jgi:SAM-dependent methyltransferase
VTPHWRDVPLVCPLCRGAIAPGTGGARCTGCAATYPERDGILQLLGGSSGAPGYDPHFFETLENVEDRHFWFLGRREVILAALRRAVPDLARRRLFDVGCGTGGLLLHFQRRGLALAGACDVYPESLRVVRRRLQLPLVQVDLGREPPLGPGHDLLGLFDVLEHVDDDRAMLRSLRGALQPGGVLVLTVPAHPRLFDEMDELAFHRRRYTRRSLAGALREAGLEVRLLSHFMAPLVPALFALRSVGRRLAAGGVPAARRRRAEFRVVPGLNGALRAMLAVERLALGRLQLPFGSSIVAVASRPS